MRLTSAAIILFPLLLVSAGEFRPVIQSSDSIDIFVECKCVPAIELEIGPAGIDPWIVSWTREDDNVDGICAASYCGTLFDPRPCDGSFKISVGWGAGPSVPVPPCATATTVDYANDGQSVGHLTGTLDLVNMIVHERHAGQTKVNCNSKSQNGPDGRQREADDTVSRMRMSCATVDGQNHTRLFDVREVCIGCDKKPE